MNCGTPYTIDYYTSFSKSCSSLPSDWMTWSAFSKSPLWTNQIGDSGTAAKMHKNAIKGHIVQINAHVCKKWHSIDQNLGTIAGARS
jgi:hypothetical protein